MGDDMFIDAAGRKFSLVSILVRADGTYLVDMISQAGAVLPYAVPPDTEEFAELYAAVSICAAEHPERVQQEPEIEEVPPTLEEVKAAKLAEINAGCDAILKQAVSGYPETEQQTFYKQDAESAAYLENPETETPFLTILAAARGIDLETMVTKVRAKTDAFSRLSAFICGQRQAMEDELDACETIEEVQALVVSYQLPETL